MNNKMIKLLAVVGGLLLMSPIVFAGSEPNPGDKPENLTPVISKVKLSIAPAAGMNAELGECGGGSALGPVYSGDDCVLGDLTIAGTCEGLPVIGALRGSDLRLFGLVPGDPGDPGYPLEDITDITKEQLVGRVLPGIGNIFASQNPGLDNNGCPVSERSYQIRRVKGFVNNAGVISAEIHLVPVQ